MQQRISQSVSRVDGFIADSRRHIGFDMLFAQVLNRIRFQDNEVDGKT
jgi:hypothetical protein